MKERGERKKLRDQDLFESGFVLEEAGVEKGLEDAWLRSWTRRFCARGSLLGSGGRRAGERGSKETEGRFRSSRTSLMVKEA